MHPLSHDALESLGFSLHAWTYEHSSVFCGSVVSHLCTSHTKFMELTTYRIIPVQLLVYFTGLGLNIRPDVHQTQIEGLAWKRPRH